MIASTGQTTGAYAAFTKRQLLASIPASDAESEGAFRELTVFETEQGYCVLPSAQLQLQTWQMILSAARATSLDLTVGLNDRDALSLRSAVEEVHDVDAALYRAVANSVTIESPNGDNKDPDPSLLVRWVGINRLGVAASTSAVSVTAFKAAWKDDLPEPWRGKADLLMLAPRYTLSDGGKAIMFRGYQLDLEEDHGTALGKDGKAGAGSKRKQWHKKFRPSKKSA